MDMMVQNGRLTGRSVVTQPARQSEGHHRNRRGRNGCNLVIQTEGLGRGSGGGAAGE